MISTPLIGLKTGVVPEIGSQHRFDFRQFDDSLARRRWAKRARNCPFDFFDKYTGVAFQTENARLAAARRSSTPGQPAAQSWEDELTLTTGCLS